MSGDDAAAMHAFTQAVRVDPTHFEALNELGTLALGRGFRKAARRAYGQAVVCHPTNPIGRINLANVLAEDGEPAEARRHYEAALQTHPDFPEAHQGLGRLLAARRDVGADAHLQKGFAGRALTARAFRGVGPAIPVLLLASVRLGNMPTQPWLDDSLFAVTVLHLEYWDATQPLPRCALVVNAVGDADLCGEALAKARAFSGPMLNPPERVAATGRAEIARRLGSIEGIVAPEIVRFGRDELGKLDVLQFPLLLRSPGYHAGQHFLRVEDRASLDEALASLPGDELLAIQYLDARGDDGMARKYRVMFVDGQMFPLHLAISGDWKVHYFSAAMADDADYRAEERCFLDDMPAVLGERGMAALRNLQAAIGLDYFGVDFAIGRDGSLLAFEVNATMVVIAPPPDSIWDYRRRAVSDVLDAAKRMALARVERHSN